MNVRLAKEMGYKSIPAGVWFGTFVPDRRVTIDLHFLRNQEENGLEAYELTQIHDPRTGAMCFRLDDVYHTVESLGALRFTLPLSDYLIREESGYQRWSHADGNIVPLEAFISARGDTAAAQKLRETFPKLFAPEPQPDLAPKPKSRPAPRWRQSKWRWPF